MPQMTRSKDLTTETTGETLGEKSRSTTPLRGPNKKKVVTVRDIKDIIESSAKFGVVEFEYETLRIKFADPALKKLGLSLSEHSQSSFDPTFSIENARETLEEIRDSQLLIDDPESFEQAMIDGQLLGRNNGQIPNRRIEPAL